MREYPFKPAQLIDIDVEVDFSQVTTADDRVAVITTEPLTQNEAWTAFAPGEMILFQYGKSDPPPNDPCGTFNPRSQRSVFKTRY